MGSQLLWGLVATPQYLFQNYKNKHSMNNKQKNQSRENGISTKLGHYFKVTLFLIILIAGCNHKW